MGSGVYAVPRDRVSTDTKEGPGTAEPQTIDSGTDGALSQSNTD